VVPPFSVLCLLSAGSEDWRVDHERTKHVDEQICDIKGVLLFASDVPPTSWKNPPDFNNARPALSSRPSPCGLTHQRGIKQTGNKVSHAYYQATLFDAARALGKFLAEISRSLFHAPYTDQSRFLSRVRGRFRSSPRDATLDLVLVHVFFSSEPRYVLSFRVALRFTLKFLIQRAKGSAPPTRTLQSTDCSYQTVPVHRFPPRGVSFHLSPTSFRYPPQSQMLRSARLGVTSRESSLGAWVPTECSALSRTTSDASRGHTASFDLGSLFCYTFVGHRRQQERRQLEICRALYPSISDFRLLSRFKLVNRVNCLQLKGDKWNNEDGIPPLFDK